MGNQRTSEANRMNEYKISNLKLPINCQEYKPKAKIKGLKSEMTIENLEVYLKDTYKNLCNSLEKQKLSSENENWIHGELAIINEILITFFNK